MPAQVTPYKDDGKLAFSNKLSPEERAAVQQRLKDLDLLLANEKRARYKIEVMFERMRSIHKPSAGIITLWESGNKLHGGGDSKVYICPGPELKKNGCHGVIPDAANSLNVLVCAACGSLWNSDQVHGEVLYKLDTDKWAEVVLRWFLRLGMDADIRIKYAKDDLIRATTKEQEKVMGGDLLRRVRSEERRSPAIYPLKHIMRDVSNGADLKSRILAFLKS